MKRLKVINRMVEHLWTLSRIRHISLRLYQFIPVYTDI